jgi:pantoate--beta-alanine ligase
VQAPPVREFTGGAAGVQIVRSNEELARAEGALKRRGSLALVPTMGALHAGHLALVEEGQRRADSVATSIFVNPAQFGEGEDFGRYPRQEEQDMRLLGEAGCDLLWLPSIEDIYPPGFSTKVSVSGVSERWEGEARPGHFDGVATVVARLLLLVRPDVALFGEKDFQQLAVIRRMVANLNIPVEIVGVPTLREKDGLALSSRNSYLSPDERKQAVALPQALEAARSAILAGTPVAKALENARNLICNGGFSRIDYFALVDAATLEPIGEQKGKMRLLAAAVIGTTRLIDNVAV